VPGAFGRFWSLGFLTGVAAITSSVALGPSPSVSSPKQPIDNSQRVTLRGNIHPLAQARYDQGAVVDSFPAERMLLLLKRSPARETALRQFIEDAHAPGRRSYHQWLTPEQFGKLYGPAESDVAGVVAWLQSHGFSVARVSRGKTAIEFSGNAGQIRGAFHTEIHTYLVQGEEHHANDGDPQIPAALAPVVAGITAMNDFRPKSYSVVLGRATYELRTHQVRSEWTLHPFALALAPSDFAVQYDLNPLYGAGINGDGVTIGIIGASNVDPAIVAAYRALFGLPAKALNVVIDGQDPGLNGAALESYLDVELAGAVAPGATINLYTSADSALESGLNLAALRAVDDDQAAVLSTSYGNCEQFLGSAGNQFWAAVWEQAAAQGQTSFVSAGDGGSAGCDNFDIPQVAQQGLGVSGFSSTPWNISVGGTDFFYSTFNGTAAAQNTELATFWNLTPTTLPANSLLKPVPEQPWNHAFGFNLSTGGVFSSDNPTIVAGSGGASGCTAGVLASSGSFASCSGGYPKPAWQTGSGVPADGVRDLPDISLFAADNANDSFYPICAFSDDCIPDEEGVRIVGIGGTSASSPAMAGIMALINQKYGPQGQANFTLYPLAAQHPSVFHDIAISSNNVPCQRGTPSCALSTLNDNTNGFYTLGQYYAGAGYDQATGLGSVDAALLLKYWTSLQFTPTTTTLSLSPTSFTHGTPVTISIGVNGNGGTPSGQVGLVTTATPPVNTGVGELALEGGTVASSFKNFPGGQYDVIAKYAGDTIFAPSSSSPVTLNVAPEASTTSVFGSYFNFNSLLFVSISDGGSYPYGSYITIDAQPTGVNAAPGSTDGIATGTANFLDTASTGTASSGPVSLTSNGVAEWIPSSGFPAGTHSLSASYSGDASFNASSSTTPLTFTIIKVIPTVNLSANASRVVVGSTTALTLLVLASNTAPAPTGTATFYSGSIVLGAASIDPDPFNPHLGAAILHTTALPLGVDSVTAIYSGDANCNPATSSAINITVQQPASVSAVVNPNPFNEAQSFALTVTVSGVAGLPAPTGIAEFHGYGDESSTSGAAALVNGSASFTGDGNSFNPGKITFDVSYDGDSTYAPARARILATETVPFSVGGTPVTIVVPGSTTGNTSIVTVTPMGGFTGAVNFTCALSGSPAAAKYLPGCSIPSSVNIAGTSAVTATMTISSTAASSSAFVFPSPNRMAWLAAHAGVALLGMVVFGIRARRRRPLSWLSFFFVMVIVGGLVACAGTGSGPGGGILGTTPGNYMFTVTAATPGPNAALPTIWANTKVTVTIQ